MNPHANFPTNVKVEIKTIVNPLVAIFTWLGDLFDPPPRNSMTQSQKIGRVFVFTVSLVVICILLSMLAAVGTFALEHVRRMFSDFSELLGDLSIIFISMLVNTLCVMVLLQIRKADRKLIPPIESPSSMGNAQK